MNPDVVNDMIRARTSDERRSIREQFVAPSAPPKLNRDFTPWQQPAQFAPSEYSDQPSILRHAPPQHPQAHYPQANYPQPTYPSAVFETPEFKDRMKHFSDLAKFRKTKDASMAKVVIALAGGAVEAASTATGIKKMKGFRKKLAESIDDGAMETVVELFSHDKYKFINNPWFALLLAISGVILETIDENSSIKKRKKKNTKKKTTKRPVYESESEEDEEEEEEEEEKEEEKENPHLVQRKDGSLRPHFGATSTDSDEDAGIFEQMSENIGPGVRAMIENRRNEREMKRVLSSGAGRAVTL
jgi:hypothetical protein